MLPEHLSLIPAACLSSGGLRPETALPAAYYSADGKVNLSEAPDQLLGHYLYARTEDDEAPNWDLSSCGRHGGDPVYLRTAAARAFSEMRRAADREGILLLPISGFRSIKDQEYLYYEVRDPCTACLAHPQQG